MQPTLLPWVRRREFPNLNTTNHEVTSQATDDYNCAAWAANRVDTWSWPRPEPEYDWPDGVRRDGTLEAFIDAFAIDSYEVCDSPEFEIGYEKVAVYANADGPQHVARQLSDGNWTSKLGPCEDIRHSAVTDVESDQYGQVALVMRRLRGEHE